MARYSNLLFIGARGHYRDDSFEILGRGDVGYTITEVADPEDRDDIGQTFYAHEYYCLTNRGETWYLNLDDEEVYYVETPSPRELQQAGLTQFAEKLDHNFVIKPDTPTPSFAEFKDALNLNPHLHLVEGGIGRLEGGEGRAAKDNRLWNYFVYFDFHYKYQNYSVDLFPDGSVEWFRLEKMPKQRLPYIFKDTLRLQSRENTKLLRDLFFTRTLQRVSVGLAALALLLLISAGGINILLTAPPQTERIALPPASETVAVDIPHTGKFFDSYKEVKLVFRGDQDYIYTGQLDVQKKPDATPTTQPINLLVESSEVFTFAGDFEPGAKLRLTSEKLQFESNNSVAYADLTVTNRPLARTPFASMLMFQAIVALILTAAYQSQLAGLFKSTKSN